MSVTTKIMEMIAKDASLVKPHVKVLDISWLNWDAIKEMGMEKIIFSKDLTLTKHSDVFLHNRYIMHAFRECMKTFGQKNVSILSNDNSKKY